MGNYILIIVVFIIMGCSTQTNKYSSVADEKNYGILNYNFKDEEIIDVTDLMINQSISTFIISSAFRVLTINTLKKINSLSDKNKEKHLKAIYIAVNYLEVGKTSVWNDANKKVFGEIKVLRRFNMKNNQCVSYKEIIKNKNKKRLNYITACNNNNNWIIQNV